MNDFTFHNPTKVLFGRDQIRHLPEELKNFGSRVLLVYGGGSIKRSGLYDKLMNLMNEAGLTVFELPGVEPNPRHTTVNKGVRICRDNHIDVILAVGGGSTIDCAKAVAATTFAPTDNVWDIVERKVSFDKALPIVTVVMIAATGNIMNDAKAAIDALADFCYNTLGLESHLSALGIGEENFDKMAEAACWGGELKGFKPLKKEDIVNIYRMCL